MVHPTSGLRWGTVFPGGSGGISCNNWLGELSVRVGVHGVPANAALNVTRIFYVSPQGGAGCASSHFTKWLADGIPLIFRDFAYRGDIQQRVFSRHESCYFSVTELRH